MKAVNIKKTILVAPLHWGLGHATRCIPIVNALLKNDYQVLLGSDGGALILLEKEFPHLESIELPSYDITYPEDGVQFRYSLLLKLPYIKATIGRERKMVKNLVASGKIDGIISDNRLGVYHRDIPCAYITHQVKVLSGNTTFFSSKLHKKTIQKFDVCWIPDVKNNPNLSGELGHPDALPKNIQYIGPLSRFKKTTTEIKRDILVLLSGPEPQRTLLEKKLIVQLADTAYSVLVVQGVFSETQKWSSHKNIQIVNFVNSVALNNIILSSKIIICRPGYTTLMDLSVLQKKAFLIPTPGQFEQEYLAQRLQKKNILPSCTQDEFKVSKLEVMDTYRGLEHINFEIDLGRFFSLFEGKREFRSYS